MSSTFSNLLFTADETGKKIRGKGAGPVSDYDAYGRFQCGFRIQKWMHVNIKN